MYGSNTGLIMPFLTYSDIFIQATWQELASLQDPDLCELAKSLPAVVLRSKAPSTVKKYSGVFLHWKQWAQKRILKYVYCLPVHYMYLYTLPSLSVSWLLVLQWGKHQTIVMGIPVSLCRRPYPVSPC